jgi:hypothetical protein
MTNMRKLLILTTCLVSSAAVAETAADRLLNRMEAVRVYGEDVVKTCERTSAMERCLSSHLTLAQQAESKNIVELQQQLAQTRAKQLADLNELKQKLQQAQGQIQAQPQRKFCDTACVKGIQRQALQIFGPAGYQTLAARQWIQVQVAARNGVDFWTSESHSRTTTDTYCPAGYNC